MGPSASDTLIRNDPERATGSGSSHERIADAIARIRARIADAARAAGRDPDAIALVAVSKFHAADAVEAALAAGQRRFGENRVPEAAAKFGPAATRRTGARLHIIGPLQTNKARDAVRIADVIEVLDRPRLADAIADAAEREGRLPELFVQVNVGDEAQKSGVPTAEADRFIDASLARFGGAVRGLMCIPPEAEDPVAHFATLAAMARRHGLASLSMGMSGDFEAAIASGATAIRVGTAIFGPRPQTDAPPTDAPPPGVSRPNGSRPDPPRNDVPRNHAPRTDDAP